MQHKVLNIREQLSSKEEALRKINEWSELQVKSGKSVSQDPGGVPHGQGGKRIRCSKEMKMRKKKNISDFRRPVGTTAQVNG